MSHRAFYGGGSRPQNTIFSDYEEHGPNLLIFSFWSFFATPFGQSVLIPIVLGYILDPTLPWFLGPSFFLLCTFSLCHHFQHITWIDMIFLKPTTSCPLVRTAISIHEK